MTDESAQIARNLPVIIHAQYIRDLSFENPNAPQVLKPSAGRPEMDMSINIGMREVKDEELPGMYEVSLRIRAAAKRGEMTAFIIEVDYAASVTVGGGVDQETIHPLLMIEIPRLIFPFARQIIAEMSQQGGFPAVMIAPVDFQTLYVQRFAQEMEATKQAG
ncbi:MAG: Protein export cytoplasm chaperone protein [Micavibrio sp.]|nr:Protein export cytoplasm chaperone protein [Micavibrio sp.]